MNLSLEVWLEIKVLLEEREKNQTCWLGWKAIVYVGI